MQEKGGLRAVGRAFRQEVTFEQVLSDEQESTLQKCRQSFPGRGSHRAEARA